MVNICIAQQNYPNKMIKKCQELIKTLNNREVTIWSFIGQTF